MKHFFTFLLMFIIIFLIVNSLTHISSIDLYVQSPEVTDIMAGYESEEGGVLKNEKGTYKIPASGNFEKVSIPILERVTARNFEFVFTSLRYPINVLKIEFIGLGMPVSFSYKDFDKIFKPKNLTFFVDPSISGVRLAPKGPEASIVSYDSLFMKLLVHKIIYIFLITMPISLLLFLFYIFSPQKPHTNNGEREPAYDEIDKEIIRRLHSKDVQKIDLDLD